MPQLLLELFSEEIPARMQGQAARDLERMAGDHLAKAGLDPESLKAYAGPRRLTLVAEGLPTATPDRTEELKGPRTTAPDQALDGFLRKTGLTKAQLTERDGVYYAELTTPGRTTADIVAEMVPAILAGFPWPKSMRSAASPFRWVRPLKRILCLFDGKVVLFEAGGVTSGDETEGHRFMGGGHGALRVADFDHYQATLREHSVLLDPSERKRIILERARALCAAEGLELVEDEGLADEVAGLAEWPVPILGRMDPAFLDLPPEVIRTSMRTHQKYFAVRNPQTGALAPRFVVVANIEPADGGAVIAAGNAKVLSARLNDARFFWDQDRAPGSFDKWLKKLEGVTFHAKLGTMKERVDRIEALAVEIAPLVGADPELTRIAARYCKADLASGMVGEFPELQGVMGGYYARASFETLPAVAPQDDDGGLGSTNGGSTDHARTAPPNGRHADEGASAPVSKHADRLTQSQVDQIADAIRDHYKPVGPSDSVPTAPVTVAVALADKLDTLVGFFAIDEKPTGSKDPYALRRAALGVIRIILGRYAIVPLRTVLFVHGIAVRRKLLAIANDDLAREMGNILIKSPPAVLPELVKEMTDLLPTYEIGSLPEEVPPLPAISHALEHVRRKSPERFASAEPLMAFFADRLKVLLRDEGKRHDLVDAVFALGDDDLVRITRRVEALSEFLATEDGANLLAGYKRATNILKAEEKKHPEEADLYRLNPELGAMALDEERALAAALRTEVGAVDEALAAEDFTRAMRHLAHLRAPVDAFFDKVLVNDPDPEVRLTRLRLLTQVRDTANRVADFSLISG